tara:strand:+ start:970 stop:1746 length:777 start_codon:yes stop_codon:yes gene_type:complete
MKFNYKKITEELFPNYSSFDRAIKYPYFAPNYSFSFYKGEFIKGICDDLNNRIPILSVGSNRSPYQLKRKFSLGQNICVTPATLYDSDVVYAASISSYGSIPATQWPSKGTEVDLNVLWLNEEQLEMMHLSEALGVAYNFVKLKLDSVKIKDFKYEKQIYGYISIAGVFPFNDNKPKRLSLINAKNVVLEGSSEKKALSSLIYSLGIEENRLSEWVVKVINNKTYRISLLEKLKSKAIKPQNLDWEIVKKSIRGNLII